ncbi:hypothetical protein [Chondromyces apiculatus]|uniref:Uncharacterized protein n=1 Tax=Chondromyces apiculatus DSM 436 TaxID=1192034 RepID=A0A017T521_9BACT|nr:hypothetical protein [Chondromyces apiculatus]EYF03651.1 Hypothetical protein CAP_5262 [Chondromyces apiculatus DSM 436]
MTVNATGEDEARFRQDVQSCIDSGYYNGTLSDDDITTAYEIYSLAKKDKSSGVTIVGRLVRAASPSLDLFAPALVEKELNTARDLVQQEIRALTRDTESARPGLLAKLAAVDAKLAAMTRVRGGTDVTAAVNAVVKANGMSVAKQLDAVYAFDAATFGRDQAAAIAQLSIGKLTISTDKFVESTEDFPGIDPDLRANFLSLNEEMKSQILGTNQQVGAVLNSTKWTLLANDAWLLGGIHQQGEIQFASPLQWSTLWDEAFERPTVTGREVIGICRFGYELFQNTYTVSASDGSGQKSGPATLMRLGSGARVADPARAKAATLVDYNEEILRKTASRSTFIQFFKLLGHVTEGPAPQPLKPT